MNGEKVTQAILAVPLSIWMVTAKFQPSSVPIPWTGRLEIEKTPAPHEFWIAIILGAVLIYLSSQWMSINNENQPE
jgi:hypothetical protein